MCYLGALNPRTPMTKIPRSAASLLVSLLALLAPASRGDEGPQQAKGLLGPGLLESVYEVLLARSLERRGLTVERQKPIRLEVDGVIFDEAFRADILVNDLVIVELKSVEELHPAHNKQLKTYLRVAQKHLGLLINFGAPLFKNGVSRVVLGLRDPRRLAPLSVFA